MRGCALPLPQPRMPRADHPAQSDLVLRSVQTRWCAGGGWRCASGRLGRWRETPDGTVWHFELPADLAGLGPPLGSFFGFSAEGCWPDCPPSVPSVVAVPPGSFFSFSVEDCWPEALVPSSPCAAEPLEPGSATATAPRHHPSAGPLRVRKHLQRSANATEPRSRPRAKGSLVSSRTLQHCRMVRPSGIRESQTKCVR